MKVIRKDPRAPAQVRRRVARLKRVVVDEISSVDEGANQLADVILYKARHPVTDDEKARRRRERVAAAGHPRSMHKVQQVRLDEEASSGPAHSHGPAELPDGVISAGTFRFGTGGAEDHDHTVNVNQTLQPGDQVTLVSSVGGPTPHQHNVTITARDVVQQSRYKRLQIELAKAFSTDGDLDQDALFDLIEKLDDEPRTFGEVRFDRNLHSVDEAIDDRANALMFTTFEILMSDADDKEALLLAAVDDFAAMMGSEIPQLMDGRLSKLMTEFLSADDPPAFTDVRERVDKLLNEGSSGGTMFEKKTDAEGTALGKLWQRGLDAGTAETEVAKAWTAGAALKAENDRLKKALAGDTTDDDVHPLLKGKSPEEVALLQPLIELMTSEIGKANGRADSMQVILDKQVQAIAKAARTTFVEDLAATATPVPELVEMMKKADDAGFGDEFRKQLTAQDELVKSGLQEVGSSIESDDVGIGKGTANASERATADDAVMKHAHELRKGRESEMTIEQAYVQAGKDMPTEVAIAAGNVVQ